MNAPASPRVLEFAREELAGKLKAMCVGLLESLKNPWNMTSEKNQQIALNKMEEVIDEQVRRAVMVIATNRRPNLSATVESVTFKDGIKAVLTLDKHAEGRHDLADSEGTTVSIVMANPEQYTGGMEKVNAALDQPGLPLGSEPQAREPEIRQESDKTYAVYQDPDNPMVGGTGFKTHEAAEKWLQKQLGIEKKKTPKKPAAPAADAAPPAAEPTPPDLEVAKAAFFEAAKAEVAKENGEWEAGWTKIVAQYPSAWVQDNYADLSASYADGWEKGTED